MRPDRSVIKVFVAAETIIRDQLSTMIEKSPGLSLAGTASNGHETLTELPHTGPDIALLDIDLPGISGQKIAEYVSFNHPDINSMIVSKKKDIELFRFAMLAGAREFITLPIDREELAFSIKRVAEIARTQTRRRGTAVREFSGEEKNYDSQCIVIVGGKGGVGSSFIAANIAGSLTESPVAAGTALVDFNLTSPDMSVILDVNPAKSLNDLVAAADMDSEIVSSAAFRVEHGFDLFAGGDEAGRVPHFNEDQIISFIEICRLLYNVIIFDVGAYYSESAEVVIRAADIIALITTSDVLSVRAASRFTGLLRRIGFDRETVKPVINKWSKGDMARERISRYIGLNAVATLPSSPAVNTVIENGRLLTADDDLGLKKTIDRLSKILTGTQETEHIMHA